MKISEFKLLTLINKGAYGEVYRSLHIPSNKEYAVKIINKTNLFKSTEAVSIFREKEILRLFNYDRHIVNLRASFQD